MSGWGFILDIYIPFNIYILHTHIHRKTQTPCTKLKVKNKKQKKYVTRSPFPVRNDVRFGRKKKKEEGYAQVKQPYVQA